MKPLRELVRVRWLRFTAIALVLALPVWLLVVNVALWTGAVEALVTHDGKLTRLQLTHGWAWMAWPTRVHVHDATFSIDGYSYQLGLEVEYALVDIHLASLFDRRVRFDSIEATGVRAEYRAKVDAEEAGDPDLAAYSPFDGTPPQVQSSTPKPVPADEDAWGVDLFGIDAEVDMLWVDEFDFEPCGHVAGEMHWVDGGDFSLPSTTLTLQDGVLWLGGYEALRGLDVDASVSIDAFDTSEADNLQLPRFISFAAKGDGELVDPASFSVWWPKIDGMVGAAPGPVTLDVTAQTGVIDIGSRVHHRSTSAWLGDIHHRVHGAVELELLVEEHGKPSARVRMREVTLRGKGVGEVARTTEARASLTVPTADMAQPWSLERAQAETDEVVLEDLRRLSAMIDSKSVQLDKGSARGHLAAQVVGKGHPSARYDLHADDVVLATGPVRISGDLDSSGRVTRDDEDAMVADELILRSTGVTVKSPYGTSKDTWIKLHDGSVRVKGEDVVVETRGKVEDGRPAVVHLTKLDPFLKVVPDLEKQIPIKVHGKFAVAGSLIELDMIDIEYLGVHVGALWRKRGPHWRLALLGSGLTAFGFTHGDDHEVGIVVPLVGKPWFADKRRWVRQLGAGKRAAAKPD